MTDEREKTVSEPPDYDPPGGEYQADMPGEDNEDDAKRRRRD